MRARTIRHDKPFQFRRPWWDSDYLPAILLSAWGGIVWSLIALFASITWDLDQRWYDTSPALLLPLKVALLWPVWGSVQVADALGWNSFGGTLLLLAVMGIPPAVLVACSWVRLTNRD